MEKHYDKNYIIHSDGRIYSNISKKFLKPGISKKGYFFCIINKKYKSIHRLVAETFIPNPDNLPEVNHKDLDKSNNTIENLEWVTTRKNILHRYNSKLPGVQITPSGKFRSKYYFNKKYIHLGTFNTPEEASQAYTNALALYMV